MYRCYWQTCYNEVMIGSVWFCIWLFIGLVVEINRSYFTACTLRLKLNTVQNKTKKGPSTKLEFGNNDKICLLVTVLVVFHSHTKRNWAIRSYPTWDQQLSMTPLYVLSGKQIKTDTWLELRCQLQSWKDTQDGLRHEPKVGGWVVVKRLWLLISRAFLGHKHKLRLWKCVCKRGRERNSVRSAHRCSWFPWYRERRYVGSAAWGWRGSCRGGSRTRRSWGSWGSHGRCCFGGRRHLQEIQRISVRVKTNQEIIYGGIT